MLTLPRMRYFLFWSCVVVVVVSFVFLHVLFSSLAVRSKTPTHTVCLCVFDRVDPSQEEARQDMCISAFSRSTIFAFFAFDFDNKIRDSLTSKIAGHTLTTFERKVIAPTVWLGCFTQYDPVDLINNCFVARSAYSDATRWENFDVFAGCAKASSWKGLKKKKNNSKCHHQGGQLVLVVCHSVGSFPRVR